MDTVNNEQSAAAVKGGSQKKPNTKEELINNIREWIKIDNDINNLK